MTKTVTVMVTNIDEDVDGDSDVDGRWRRVELRRQFCRSATARGCVLRPCQLWHVAATEMVTVVVTVTVMGDG